MKRALMIAYLLVAVVVAVWVSLAANSNVEGKGEEVLVENETCSYLGEAPPPPPAARELTDRVSLARAQKLVYLVKADTNAATVVGKPYALSAPFSDVEQYYSDKLSVGWEQQERLEVNQATTHMRAWTSCQEELLAVTYYENTSRNGSLLVVTYAGP